MRTFLIHILSGLLLTSLLSCSCGKKSNSPAIESLNDPLIEYSNKLFVSDYNIDYNETNEYVIISKAYKNKPSDPFPTIRFEILLAKPLELLFKDAVPGGKVTWVEDYIAEVISYRVIPSPDDTNTGPKTYRYHAKNRKKYSGAFLRNKN